MMHFKKPLTIKLPIKGFFEIESRHICVGILSFLNQYFAGSQTVYADVVRFPIA